MDLTKALHLILQEKEPDKTGPLIKTLRERVFQAAPVGILKGDNRVTAQHDAHEFFQFTLEQLQWPTFGTRTKIITSKGTRYSDAEQHRILSLPLIGITFQETIDAYFSPERCKNEKEPYRGEFGGTTYKFTKREQQPEMRIFPDFLFVQLKRFSNEGAKDSKKILFPLDGIVNIAAQSYEIIGFVNHYGPSAERGHYTADIKNLRDPAQELWVRCEIVL